MKTRLFSLLAALTLLAGGMKADEITALKLTLSVDGGEAFTQEFPAKGWEELVIGEPVSSIKIMKAELQTSGSVLYTALTATMYSTSQGGQTNDDEWRVIPLENTGDGKWELSFDEGIDLVEQDWLNKKKTKTFEFYALGVSSTGSNLLYNNGGANYKVTFSTGEGGNTEDWKVKFLDEETASLSLRIDDMQQDYDFNGDGSRSPDEQPGQLSSLVIERFSLSFFLGDGLSTKDVSLQYRVYEESKEPGGWNRLDAQQYIGYSNVMYCYADGLECSVAGGLEPGKDYVLEAHYQVVVGGDYVFLGKDAEGSKFRFSVGESAPTEGIRNLSLTISHDGEVFTQSFPASGWQNLIVSGQTTSLKILRAEVEADESMQYVGFCATMYNAEDGWQQDDEAWVWTPLEYQGNGIWAVDLGDEGHELVEKEWLGQNKTKTFEFFAQAGDSDGNDIFYANGQNDYGYNNNYKVTFSTGEGGNTEDWKVKFYRDGTASLSLSAGGEVWSCVFDGDGARQPSGQPGDVYSLAISGFSLFFIQNDNVSIKDVSLQYRVYEPGQDGMWNRLDAQQIFTQDVWNEEKNRMEHQTICQAGGLEQQLTDALSYGKDYVLEVTYQVCTTDGDYFFLGKDREDSRLHFYFDTETGMPDISLSPAGDTPCYKQSPTIVNLAGQQIANGGRQAMGGGRRNLPQGIVVTGGRKFLIRRP